MTNKHNNKMGGIIGVTDNGFPIVTDTHTCPYWEVGAEGLYKMRECWYCKYADFRKSSRFTLQQSICRNPRCRVAPAEEVPQNAKNEGVRYSVLDLREKPNRFRILRVIPGWLWRLVAAVLFGWLAYVNIVPWVAAQRGYSTVGGEYLAVLMAVILPFCIFRR